MTIDDTASGRVDIHSHVLPHIDDGARDVDEALDMLRMAKEDGTSRIVATPHGIRADVETIRQVTDALRLEAQAADIEIGILTGCEVKFSATLAEDFRAGRLLTINDQNYLLVEFSFRQSWSLLVNTSLYALQLAGVTPIVAHAERYPAVQENPSVLLDLVATGIPIQINAGSLLGLDGNRARQTAELLLHAGIVHVVASDGHRRDTRTPLLSGALRRTDELAGPGTAHRIQQNAVRIISGQALNLPEPDIRALKPASRIVRMFSKLRTYPR